MRHVLWFGLALVSPATLVLAAASPSAQWQLVPIGAEPRIIAVTVNRQDASHVLAASTTAVYETRDDGSHWTLTFRTPAGSQVRALALGAAAWACTSQGLYARPTPEALWMPVTLPEETAPACTALRWDAHHPRQAWLGAAHDLYHSDDGGQSWQRVRWPAAAGDVLDIAADTASQRIYVLTTAGLFFGPNPQGPWMQRTPLPAAGTDEATASAEASEDAPATAPSWRAIALHPHDAATVYAATVRGMRVSTDEGRTWQPLARSGLLSTDTAHVLLQAHSPVALYAATTRGVARFYPTQHRWQMFAAGLAAGSVHQLDGSAGTLWAATDHGLFRYAVPVLPGAEGVVTGPEGLLQDFPHEPTIGQVQAAAIRYAEVHPDKIRHWRRLAALQALLPSLSFGLDRDHARNVHYDEGAFPNFQVIETTDRDAGFDVSVSWDFGELIWNNDQTSIDTRSKLMVELREDIVDTVTRTYFERRRLQTRLLLQPLPEAEAALEQELRLAELTALLDGLTGGYFSQPQEVR